MAGVDNEIIFGQGIDLSGNAVVENQLDEDGKIYIGSSTGNPLATVPTSTDSALNIVPGDGTLDFQIGSGITNGFIPTTLTTKGDLLSWSGGLYKRLGVGSDGQFLKANSATATGLEWGAGGGGASPLTTKGDIYTYTTVDARLGVGTDGYILSANSAQATGLEWIANTTGTVTSVSGTTNRISSTGGATPVIDIDAAYVGQTSITTLGTVSTGTWTATDIAVADGGTGRSTATAYAVICGGTTATGAHQSIAGLGTSGQVLTSNGAGALPTFQDAGGGASPLTTKGDIYTYSTADARLAVGTDGFILSANSGETTGLEWIANTVGTVTDVTGTADRITSSGGATPAIDIAATYVGQTSITTLGTIGTGTWQGTTIAVNQGGTGQTSYTNGQLLIGNTTGNTLAKATLTAGTGITINNGTGSIEIVADNNGTVTSVSGTLNRISSTGGATPVIDIDSAYVGQATITTLGTVTTGTWTATDIAVADGGTGRSTATAYAVICGGTTATGAHQSIAGLGTSGQVLTSNGAGALPTFQEAGGGGGGLTWNSVAGTTQTASVNNGYIIANSSQTTVTLPTTAAVGDIVAVTGLGAGGWVIDYGTGQVIHFLSQDTTTTSGSLTSTQRYNSVELQCIVTNDGWSVIRSSGNITIA